MPEGEIGEVHLSPTREVAIFHQRAWHHRLVDEKTVEHRRQFPEKFAAWCRPWGLKPNSLVAVLCGSSQWSTNHRGFGSGSDWDFILYGPNKVLEPYQARRARERFWNSHAEQIYDDWEIHPEAIWNDSELTTVSPLAPLLLTPDNFIAGNLELAHEYRRRLLGLTDPSPDELQGYFDKYMKGWPNVTWPKSRTGNRRERFEKALEVAAKSAGHGIPKVEEKFGEKFSERMEGFEPPSLETFRRAVVATSGKFI